MRFESRLSRREAIALLGASAALGFRSAEQLTFPRGAVMRTVLGDVAPATLGTKATLFHEHLSFEWARVTGRQDRPGPDKDADPILDQLRVAASEGVGCIVDAGTTDV